MPLSAILDFFRVFCYRQYVAKLQNISSESTQVMLICNSNHDYLHTMITYSYTLYYYFQRYQIFLSLFSKINFSQKKNSFHRKLLSRDNMCYKLMYSNLTVYYKSLLNHHGPLKPTNPTPKPLQID